MVARGLREAAAIGGEGVPLNAPSGIVEGVVLPPRATALQLIVALDEQAADDGGMFQV